MGRQRKGAITKKNGKLYARIQFVDENGRNRDIWKRADSPKEAREIIKQIHRELEDNGTKSLDAANMTFAELCDYFQTNYLKPAEYVGDRKIAGARSIIPALAALKPLREHFGKRPMRSITYSEIRSYKAIRLKTPTRFNTQRSIAATNRELSKLKRLFSIAKQEQWIQRRGMLVIKMMKDGKETVHVPLWDEHNTARHVMKIIFYNLLKLVEDFSACFLTARLRDGITLAHKPVEVGSVESPWRSMSLEEFQKLKNPDGSSGIEY